MAAADRELQEVRKSYEAIKKPGGIYNIARMGVGAVGDITDIEADVEITIEIAAAVPTAGVSLAVALARWMADNAKDLIIDAILAISEIHLNRHKKKLNECSNLMVTVVSAGQQRIDVLSTELALRQAELTQITGIVRAQTQYARAQVSGTIVPLREWRAPRTQQAQSKQAAGKLRSIGSRISKTKIFLRSQWMQKLGRYAADFIPWIQSWPWRTFGIWKDHRKYKKAYNQVKKDYTECVAFKQAEPRILSEISRDIDTTLEDIESARKALEDIREYVQYELRKAA